MNIFYTSDCEYVQCKAPVCANKHHSLVLFSKLVDRKNYCFNLTHTVYVSVKRQMSSDGGNGTINSTATTDVSGLRLKRHVCTTPKLKQSNSARIVT